MAYRLRDDEPIVDGLVRIVLEQIDRALAEVANPQLPRPEAVHEVRKRCKKIRGLLRLARASLLNIYQAEDDWFRDASRKLAGMRQADATLVVLESLRSGKSRRLADQVVNRMRESLATCHQGAGQAPDADAPLAEFSSAMQEARGRVEQSASQHTGSDESVAAVLDGFRRTYRRGRRALKIAQQVQADEYLHEFRKWAKYHWHQIKLLEKLGPRKKFLRRDKRLAELSDLLGDDRDLSTLRHELLERVQSTDSSCTGRWLAEHPDEVDEVVAAIDRRRGRLRRQAFRLAQKLYREKPAAFVRRLERRWK